MQGSNREPGQVRKEASLSGLGLVLSFSRSLTAAKFFCLTAKIRIEPPSRQYTTQEKIDSKKQEGFYAKPASLIRRLTTEPTNASAVGRETRS
jgi:hypothetical protein